METVRMVRVPGLPCSLNKRSVYQRYPAKDQVSIRKLLKNHPKKLIQKIRFNKSFPETPYRREIGYFCVKADAQKPLETQPVYQCIFQTRITQTI